MNQCTGLMGRLFGHKYEGRYSDHYEKTGFEFPANLWSRLEIKGTEMPRTIETTTYHGDVCVRCGGLVNPQKNKGE